MRYILIIIVLLFASQAKAKELYVNDSTGTDTTTYAANDSGTPWKTIGRAAWGSTNRAAPNSSEAAQAGDTVNVAAGTYDASTAVGLRYDPIYNPVNEGTSGNPITFLASGVVTLTSSTGGNGEPLIGSLQKDYIIWDGFTLNEANINTAPDTGPVVIWSSANCTIRNNIITGTYYAWNDNHNGIRCEWSTDTAIFNNVISKFRYYANSNDSKNCAAIMFYDTTRANVYNNTIHDCGSGISVKVGNTGPFNIYKNLIYNCGVDGLYIQQLAYDSSTNSKVYQNLIYDMRNGIEIHSYTSAYGPDNIDIVNNTIDNTSDTQGGLYFKDVTYVENLRYYNNIVSNNNRSISAETITNADFGTDTASFEHNHYYNSTVVHARTADGTYNLANWKSTFNNDQATGNGRAGEESDPQYTDISNDDYTLTSGANPENGGVDILDLDGDSSTTDAIHRGCYISGTETIGATVTPALYSGISMPSGANINIGAGIKIGD